MASNGVLNVSDSEQRPQKRLRPLTPLDQPPRTYPIPHSGASGVHSEGDSGLDSAAKKVRKRPLSCGECRRLKLKCDRVFPCQSCCKRGCAEICPDGALTGGKGSRFILANTEQLHDKIKLMSERIRQLEEALQEVHKTTSPAEHPLLRPELLLIKRSPELFGVGVEHQYPNPNSSRDSFKRDDTDLRAPSASSSRDEREEMPFSSTARQHDTHQSLNDNLTKLSRSFPSPWSMSQELDPRTRQHIRGKLPQRPEATHLCEIARMNAFWQYNPDPSETFLPNLIHSVYTTPTEALLPHRLGLLLIILAIGSRLDPSRSVQEAKAEEYHHLARVALCEVPVMDDTSFDAVTALFFMEWYLVMFCDEKKAVEYAWGILGLMTKLAHTIGIHRDGVRSKVIPEELDKRRALFWKLMSFDSRLALMLRRPPSLCLKHVDAKPPTFNFGSSGSTDALYQEWDYNFYVQCIHPVVGLVSPPVAPSISEVLGLDSKIREFQVPDVLHMTDGDGIAPSHPLSMQQAMTACTREIALLHLHRGYFIQGLSSADGFDPNDRFSPSVLAVYTSSCNLIWAVYTLYRWQPELCSRYTAFWHNCFSAAVALCFFVMRAPSSPLTPPALRDLDKVNRLFNSARSESPLVAKVLPALELLLQRCVDNYLRHKNGLAPQDRSDEDEICVLARKTGIMAQNITLMELDDDNHDPFELAHPTLRRCRDQAVTPLANDDTLVKIDDLIGSGTPLSGSSHTLLSSLIQESLWMSWF